MPISSFVMPRSESLSPAEPAGFMPSDDLLDSELPQHDETILIYNTASVDSVLASAIFCRRENIQTAFPAGDYRIRNAYQHYHWVGVEPTKATAKTLKGEHHGYFTHEPACQDTFKHLAVSQWSKDPEIITPNTLVAYLMESESDPVFRSLYWKLGLAIEGLQECKRDLSLEDQAFIYANLQHARISLANRTPFEPIAFHTEMLPAYLTHLKMLKVKIGQIWNHTTILLDGRHTVIPVINIGSDLSPWAIKLISCTYDSVVTFEHGKNTTVYTVFSRLSGFRNVFEKCLGKSDPKTHILFSGEL